MIAFITAITCVALHAPAGTMKLSDAARVYARKRQAAEGVAMDVDNTPRLALELRWPTVQLDLEYAPRIAWLDVLGSNASPTLILHAAALSVVLRQPRYALSLTQTGTIGDQDFTQVGVSTAPGVDTTPTDMPATPATAPGTATPTTSGTGTLDLLPRAQVVSVASEETRLGLHYLWSRRWSSNFHAGLGFSGGANAAARASLPRQRTAELASSLAYQLSRRDELDTRLTGTQVETSNGYSHRLLSLREQWARRLGKLTTSELGVGVALQDTTLPSGSSSGTWLPTADAGLAHAILMRDVQARFAWSVGYAPEVNILLGTLQGRLRAGTRAGLTFERTSLGLSVEATQTLPTDAPDSVRAISADITLERELLEWLSMQLGGQITWQRFASNTALTTPLAVWLLYAGLVGHAPALRF